MNHEKDVLTQVTASRSMAASGGADPKQVAQNEGMLTGALRQLFAVAENYPQLKADANFRQFQDELVQTEGKIAFSRQFYNDTVMMFNTKIEVFPANILAGMFGFQATAFFEMDDPTDRAPVKVDFTSGHGRGPGQ